MAPAVDALESAIIERKLSASKQSGAQLEHGQRGRDHGSGRRPQARQGQEPGLRIDGAVALTMLAGLRSRDRVAKPLDIEAMIA